MSVDVSTSDYLSIQNILFEWAEGYDNKDWERLKKVLALTAFMDYRPLGGPFSEKTTPDEFAAAVSGLIGDARIKTQHFLGVSRWKELEAGVFEVEHQARVAHQRYAAEDLKEVVNHGHAHGSVTHTLKKIDGAWKIIGYKPRVEWTEYDLQGTLNPGGAPAGS